MKINRLHIVQFKNYEEAQLKFHSGFNFITGLNGVGKTNLLDAIYYLSMTKSFFHNRDQLNVLEGRDFFRLVGVFEENGKTEKIVAKVKPGTLKKFERNGNAYGHLIEHVGFVPVLMSAPADSELVMSSSQVRRKFVDGIISQMDRTYLSSLVEYNRYLRQRNAGLKQKPVNYQLMDVYSEKMAEPARYIHETRKKMIEELLPIYDQLYKHFGGEVETSSITYKSQLHQKDFLEATKQALQSDGITGRTSIGVHRDDFVLRLNGHLARQFASQGQMKSILFALHLSKYQILKSHTGKTPIMLLDDIFDKLDDRRVGLLLDLISSDHYGQIFVTDTSYDRLKEVVERIGVNDYGFYRVDHGVVEEIETESE